jgi:hypothetical protein
MQTTVFDYSYGGCRALGDSRILRANSQKVYPERNLPGRIFLEKKSRPAAWPLDTATVNLL